MRKITLAYLAATNSFALYIDDVLYTRDEPDLCGTDVVLRILERAGILKFDYITITEDQMEEGFPPKSPPVKS